MEGIRFLTEEEMLIVAGGYGDDEVEEIEITAYKAAEEKWYSEHPFENGPYTFYASCYLNQNPSGTDAWTCQGWNRQGGGYVQYSANSDLSHDGPLL